MIVLKGKQTIASDKITEILKREGIEFIESKDLLENSSEIWGEIATMERNMGEAMNQKLLTDFFRGDMLTLKDRGWEKDHCIIELEVKASVWSEDLQISVFFEEEADALLFNEDYNEDYEMERENMENAFIELTSEMDTGYFQADQKYTFYLPVPERVTTYQL